MMDLVPLLEGVESGEIALPDFQRDYDWDEEDVLALLVTVFSGWPAGSLMLMKGKSSMFKLRPFDQGPPVSAIPEYVVLDGQQRLTSLYHALHDQGGNVYAISFGELPLDSADLQDAIVYYSRAEWNANLRTPLAQVSEKLIPCYAFRSPSTFFEWRDEALASVGSSQSAELKNYLTRLYSDRLSVIHKYAFPVVILEANLAPAAIAKIFERVNRHGMDLGAFDLMVAQVYEPSWNLRDKWEAFRRESEWVPIFLGHDGMPVLQTLSLRYSNDLRQAGVLSLPKRIVHEGWDRAAQAVEAALKFLNQHCGVRNPEFLPYKGMLVPIACLAFDYDLYEHVKVLREWFWSTAFAQSYDAAANTRLVSDYNTLAAILAGRRSSAWPKTDELYVVEASRKSRRAVWSAFLCALGASSPSGLFPGVQDSLESEVLQPVSLFSRNEPLLMQGEPFHLRVLGVVLVSRSTSRELRKLGLCGFLRSQIQVSSVGEVDQKLDRQFLPPSGMLLSDGFSASELLEYRVRRLARFLKEYVGVEILTASGERSQVEEL